MFHNFNIQSLFVFVSASSCLYCFVFLCIWLYLTVTTLWPWKLFGGISQDVEWKCPCSKDDFEFASVRHEEALLVLWNTLIHCLKFIGLYSDANWDYKSSLGLACTHSLSGMGWQLFLPRSASRHLSIHSLGIQRKEGGYHLFHSYPEDCSHPD